VRKGRSHGLAAAAVAELAELAAVAELAQDVGVSSTCGLGLFLQHFGGDRGLGGREAEVFGAFVGHGE
jgi:hypothetical protein